MIKKVRESHLIRESKDFKLEKSSEEYNVDGAIVSKLQDELDSNKRCVIKLVDGDCIELSSKQELEHAITSHLDIQSIIVEEVKVDGVKRSIFEIAKKGGTNNLLSLADRNKPEFTEKINRFNFEKDINQKEMESLSFSYPVEEVKELDHNVIYNREKLIKKSREIERNFFRAKDNAKLFSLGRQYSSDVALGKKSFGFSSLNGPQGVLDSIFGLSSFLNYNDKKSVCVVVSEKELNYLLQKHLDKKVSKIKVDSEDDYLLEGIHTDGTTYISIESIESTDLPFSLVLEQIESVYPILIYALPDIVTMNKKMDVYFSILKTINNMTIILHEKETNKELVASYIEFFKSYSVELKGVLFESNK